jgi:hypothetical protein
MNNNGKKEMKINFLRQLFAECREIKFVSAAVAETGFTVFQWCSLGLGSCFHENE